MENGKVKKTVTKFAPAERESIEKVRSQKEKIEVSEFLDRAMAGAPFMFFIINDKRQIIYANDQLRAYLRAEDMELLIGKRTGEVVNCIHAYKEPGGCGTSEACRYCGAIAAMLESKRKGQMVSREATLNVEHNGLVLPMNFEVSSNPFEWMEETFYILTLQNLEDKKRKEQLEKIFFHDITNKAGNVSMYLNVIGKKYIPDEAKDFYRLVKAGLDEMIEDIQYQRRLQQAEEGSMEVHFEVMDSVHLIKGIIDEYQGLAKAFDVELLPGEHFTEFQFLSDKVLIKRILGNLLKNAIEASRKGDRVTIDSYIQNNEVCFSVHNPAVMTDEIKAQVFNRSFSTKGEGRGLGTYSIKVFTERYLKGKVNFTSEKGEGTTFKISFPKKH